MMGFIIVFKLCWGGVGWGGSIQCFILEWAFIDYIALQLCHSEVLGNNIYICMFVYF